MGGSFFRLSRVRLTLVLSTLLLALLTLASSVRAHEVEPTIAEIRAKGDLLVFDLSLNLESFVAGIDLAAQNDTAGSLQEAEYQRLHALEPDALESAFTAYWPQMAGLIVVEVDGARLPLTLTDVAPGEKTAPEIARPSTLQFTAPIDRSAKMLRVGWAAHFGDLVLVQQDVEQPFDAYLVAGNVSEPFPIAGGAPKPVWLLVFDAVPVGFAQILPLGPIFVLFGLALFFVRVPGRLLVQQVAVYLAAQSAALLAGGLIGLAVGGTLIATLLAVSVLYVALENLRFNKDMPPWRLPAIFGIGVIHGVFFASVLSNGGAQGAASLAGFGIGIATGQLTVLALAFLCVFKAIDANDTAAPQPTVAGLIGVVALCCSIAALIWNDPLVTPLLIGAAVLLGLTAWALLSDRIDAYQARVARPASAAIGLCVALWWAQAVLV